MFSPVLALYRGVTAVLGVFAEPYLRMRAEAGKEDSTRLRERFGHSSQARPEGVLVWLHGASVGESGVALQLAEALGARDPSLSFLITTGTLTSAARVAARPLPRTRHVFAPIDRIDAVQRFLTHWRPDIGIFVESEIWPNLILEAHRRGVKLALVNARMSPKSIGRWARWPAAARRLNTAFALALAADRRTALTLGRLRGEPATQLGNLKLAADPPRIDVAARAALEAEIGVRPIWIAASTHEGEDEIALAAHAQVRQDFPDALLILVPRHPTRGQAIAALAHNAPRRALHQPIGQAPVYVADTMGELGLFYAVAPVAFIAGSLLPHLKGHNPAEAAKLGAAIVAGPYVESFEDIFAALFAADGAERVGDADGLARAVASLWRDPGAAASRVAAANAVIEQGAAALNATIDRIVSLLAPPSVPTKAANARA